MTDITNLTLKEARKELDSKNISSVELTDAYLKNAKDKNPDLHAYLEIFDDTVQQAKNADKRIQNGETNPLLGIPLCLKDNILIEGRKASAASKILENYTATYDATVTEKLKKEGVVFLGRTNMDEFAMGSSTENSHLGQQKTHMTSHVSQGGLLGAQQHL